jgi:hypothetical protein
MHQKQLSWRKLGVGTRYAPALQKQQWLALGCACSRLSNGSSPGTWRHRPALQALQALKKCEEMEPAPPQPQTPMQQPPSLARPATLKAVLEKEGAQALTWGSQRDAAMRRRSCEGASAHEAANGAAAASPAGPCPHRSHHRAAPPPAPSAATGAVQRVVSELNAPAKDSSKSKGFHSKLLGQLQSLVQPSGGKHAKNVGSAAADHHHYVQVPAVLGRVSVESCTIVPTPLVWMVVDGWIAAW